jgi:hypothetical protein
VNRDESRILPFAALALAVLFGLPIASLAQDTTSPAKEERVNLDSLEEAVDLNSLEEQKTGPETKKYLDEPLLPIAVSNIEVERHPLLILIALTVLVPVAAMLFPPKRKRRNLSGSAGGDETNDKKET